VELGWTVFAENGPFTWDAVTKRSDAFSHEVQASPGDFGARFFLTEGRRLSQKKNYWLGGFPVVGSNAPKARLAGGVVSACV